MARYSVIMPSYLGAYRGAAGDREKKFLRAVGSVIAQSIADWELIIVADGCNRTCELFAEIHDKRVKIVPIEKQRNFSAEMRNAGIRDAVGEYICYLDTDDILGTHHLEEIDKQINGYDWVYFYDLVYDAPKKNFRERVCDRYTIGRCGTSNFAHRRSMGEVWTRDGYARDDMSLARNLMRLSKSYRRIETPYYYVCHIPRKYDI